MIGMMWFDNDPKRAPEAKIEAAREYYEKKYGQAPNVCFVHPSTLAMPVPASELEGIFVGSVELRTTREILPNHFWIGVSDRPEQLELEI